MEWRSDASAVLAELQEVYVITFDAVPVYFLLDYNAVLVLNSEREDK